MGSYKGSRQLWGALAVSEVSLASTGEHWESFKRPWTAVGGPWVSLKWLWTAWGGAGGVSMALNGIGRGAQALF